MAGTAVCVAKLHRVCKLPGILSTCCRSSAILWPTGQQLRVRLASTRPKQNEEMPVVKPQEGQVSTATQKVKQAGKDATSTLVIVAGLGVTGVMFYAIGRELFSGQTSSGVYGKALKDCKNNTEVVDSLGEPIKGYGELSSRGRRRHVSHSEYEVEGRKHMRVKFYLEGSIRKGTAHVEVKQNDAGSYEYRYLFVDLDGFPRRTIIIEDNR